LKKVLVLILTVSAVYLLLNNEPVVPTATVAGIQETTPEPAARANVVAPATASRSQAVYGTQHSGSQIQNSGKVVRILSDDNDGSRHQRFILGLSSGQTLLMAHNIDLAPRIASLAVNDDIEFNGEYEWNSQGGVVHWTHHDPQGRHEEGWLKHKGRTYK